ncbi:DMT family transporter [Rhizohabitans arisaemae]|uniref:DMT family transporter n=1 Tax=Rhizohabitans arisaemae TaxID=2720610 RepID=UPI0024B26ECD|nr:DMT family transporter [Rhizohabitans arisaemae]
MIGLGLSIALVGAFGYALGAAVQQREAAVLGATLELTRRLRWWVGGIIGFTGACLHAVALSFAPLTVIQPVGVATLVFAVPLAAWLHGRRPLRLEIIGSLVVAAGLLLLMLLIPTHHKVPVLGHGSAIGFIATVGIIVAICLAVASRLHGSARALVLSVGAGVVTATVSTFVRVVGANLTRDFATVLHWFTVAIPLLLIGAVVLLQKSYAVGHFGVAYAGVQVVDPITSVTAGVVLLGEQLPVGLGSVALALVAASLVIAGTVTLAKLTPDHTRKEPVGSSAM